MMKCCASQQHGSPVRQWCCSFKGVTGAEHHDRAGLYSLCQRADERTVGIKVGPMALE
jgi:hypothetical protein